MKKSTAAFLLAIAAGVPAYLFDTKPLPESVKIAWLVGQIALIALALALLAFEAKD